MQAANEALALPLKATESVAQLLLIISASIVVLIMSDTAKKRDSLMYLLVTASVVVFLCGFVIIRLINEHKMNDVQLKHH